MPYVSYESRIIFLNTLSIYIDKHKNLTIKQIWFIFQSDMLMYS